MLVGLCGRSGSGKGYVAKMFVKRGVPSMDTDRIYREMTGPTSILSPCMQELKKRFGEEIVASDGSLDRTIMRSLVFGEENKSALQDLNHITHTYILEETMKEAAKLREQGADIILIDAPLLYESGFAEKCQAVICVSAPEDILIKRIIERDGLSEEDAKKRLHSQMNVKQLTDKADFWIENNTDQDVLQKRVDAILLKLFALNKDMQ